MLKERLVKVIADKRNVAIGVLSVALVVTLADDISTQNNVREARDEAVRLEEVVEGKNETIDGLESKNKELQEKVDEAKPYFEEKEREKKAEELKKEKEIYKEYLDLINNSKSYYDMTEEERGQIDLLIDGGFNQFIPDGDGNYINVSDGVYNRFSDELKAEYKEGYDRVVKDREDSLAKIQAEEEEKRAKEEAERKAKEEEEARIEREKKAHEMEYDNATRKAKEYLNVMSFSRQGLIEQLEFEGFSNEASVYAVDNITVDWNEQCAKKAEEYLNVMSFSREGLYEQLAFEGFSDEQIQYGLSSVGY